MAAGGVILMGKVLADRQAILDLLVDARSSTAAVPLVLQDNLQANILSDLVAEGVVAHDQHHRYWRVDNPVRGSRSKWPLAIMAAGVVAAIFAPRLRRTRRWTNEPGQ